MLRRFPFAAARRAWSTARATKAERMYGEESIYALIPQPVEVPVRPPMHVSMHSGVLPPTFSTFNDKHFSAPGSGYSNVAGTQLGAAKRRLTDTYRPGLTLQPPREWGRRPGIPAPETRAGESIAGGEKYMAESVFRGYETALRLHTPEAALASYPGLGGGSGTIYLMN